VTAQLAYIGVGSNLDHPHRHVAQALTDLARLPRSRLIAASPNYVSAPVGCSVPQPDYVNAVAALRTTLAPRPLLRRMHAIERRHHRDERSRAVRNTPRTLDLDLLIYAGRRLRQPGLIVPHPRMHLRAFVLKPLLDVAPFARIPGRGSARRWLRAVRDQRIQRTPTRALEQAAR
jgi:2-amino-4-hydroxy-6-hydroxymethyldihydropteridine diphosphokinase